MECIPEKELDSLRRRGAVYILEGKKTRLEVHNTMEDMGCLWFVATDRETGASVEWNMWEENINRLFRVLGIMLKKT